MGQERDIVERLREYADYYGVRPATPYGKLPLTSEISQRECWDASATFKMAIEEIDRLRSELSATRAKAIEEAAQWHDTQAARCDLEAEQSMHSSVNTTATLRDPVSASLDAVAHREYAESIRALALQGKGE